ncbi:PREDICTED: DBH-like monooxygenase protein 1 [Amphimedon queenslandica]|uniref:DOMON domain-containing protein n=2 Tax=Amphimedon queenslandica TaxID=400682 RepID=A0AAN0JHM8_AMPQE|nr:PREDICTED: DBH-like monooxygenase protein 1 [Amphimedon queenslandica]|eukprot:XP_019856277.1 PREDICTED: DBH-like monooxygenase protein 1 [Amphimedon queenslandica]
MLVYICDSLNTTDPGGPCEDVSDGLSSCLGGTLIAAWAVGAQDFIYPPNVAYGLGGNEYRYALIQMHYDNPNRLSGVIDSSGMTFYYIDTPREHNAGILQVGHAVNQYMIIPPKARNYTIYGFCSSTCTENFPEEGIHIFANALHTHLLGVGVKLYHLRVTDQCRSGSGIEELKPIDSNPFYDFDFQEVVHFDEVTVKRGDMLVLTCTYDSTNENAVTLGGESTHEEMCLTFPFYYPSGSLTHCMSTANVITLAPFLSRYYNSSQLSALQYAPESLISQIFNNIDWSPEEIQRLESSVLSSSQYAFCPEPGVPFNESLTFEPVPSIGCPYEAPPVMLECPNSIDPTTDPTSGAGAVSLITLSVTVLLFAMIAMILIN